MDSLKEQSLSKIAPPIASKYLRTVEATKEREQKPSKTKSFLEARLSSIERNEDLMITAIDELPNAPHWWGIWGKAWNLVKEAPELAVGASSYAFQGKAALQAADAYLSSLE